jgi:hypothetical protein
MKNIKSVIGVLSLMTVMVGNAQETPRWDELWREVSVLEESGGLDTVAKEKVCTMANDVLDELATLIYDRDPGLKARKLGTDLSLKRVSHEIRQLRREKHKASTLRERQRIQIRVQHLKEEKKKIWHQLDLISDEVSKRLREDERLSIRFNKLHAMLTQWCGWYN